ncbi:MAG: response regulator transcription factor [Eubacteriales bacterium]|nr:response regulator transcription factor [Eubacteriales bacterium]
MNPNLLIIEDDRKLNDGIRLALKGNSYTFFQCQTLREARPLLREHRFDLILLDVNLPDGNGIDFVREIRTRSQTPIILITVNSMELDIVTGLDAGANDYITKPFSLMVLRARVAVQLRPQTERTASHIRTGPFDFDFEKMEFRKDGRLIELSKTEQRLLRVLCENKEATLKRSYLIDTVWQGDTEYVDEHALTVTVKRLRDKLEEDSGNPRYLKTVYGIGYTWSVKAP